MCVRTCICMRIHRISCPGASGRQSDNIEKEILTVIKKSSVWTKTRQPPTPTPSPTQRSNFWRIFSKVKKPKIWFSSQVNGVSVEGKTHSEVVAAIKVGGSVTRLLVVDTDTDAYFKRCRVAPTSDHLTGELLMFPSRFISVIWHCYRHKMFPPPDPIKSLSQVLSSCPPLILSIFLWLPLFCVALFSFSVSLCQETQTETLSHFLPPTSCWGPVEKVNL